MKRFAAVVVGALGSVLVLLGLLFLVGAAGQAQRYAVALVGALLGSGLIALAIKLFQQGGALTPEHIRAEILALAKRRSGEVSEVDLQATLGLRRERAQRVLEDLLRDGLAKQAARDGTLYYTFPDLLPRLAVRRCEFCQAELPLEQELASCPRCGGTIRMDMEQVALSDDAYGMDE